MRLAWRVRNALPPDARRRFRTVADALLAPVGSLAGARHVPSTLAVTFDDGPDPDITPRVLDLLDSHDVRATFFVLTDRVILRPDLAREVVARGHEIALHGDRHDRMTLLPPAQVRQRLSAARSLLEEVVERPVHLFRPPFGAQSLRTYRAARSAGLDVVVWGPYAAEWQDGTPQDLADRAARGLAPGTVLLLHDGLEVPAGELVPKVDRVAAFDLILGRMAESQLRGTTVGDLMACGRPRRTAWFRP